MRADSPDPLEELASRAGQRWAAAYAQRLRAERRAVEGAWPGTMSEAYGWVIADLADDVRALPTHDIRALSRITYRAARIAWLGLALPDPEL